MTKRRKSKIGLLVALTLPAILLFAFHLHGLELAVGGIAVVLGARLVMDIIWPDKEDER